MIAPPSGVRVWLATGATDMRRGVNGLALQIQEALHRGPHAGDLYVFRGHRGDLPKIFGPTVWGCRCTPSVWNTGSSSPMAFVNAFGRALRTAPAGTWVMNGRDP